MSNPTKEVVKTVLPIEFTDEQLVAVHNGLVQELQRIVKDGGIVSHVLEVGQLIQELDQYTLAAAKRAKAAIEKKISDEISKEAAQIHAGNKTAH